MLIAAHGNSLRALVKYLDNMSDADIMALNIPTGELLTLHSDHHNGALSDMVNVQILCQGFVNHNVYLLVNFMGRIEFSL